MKFSTNAPHTNISLEECKTDTPYAITIAPEVQFVGYDKKTKLTPYSNPHATFFKYVFTHLEKCVNSHYELYYELSPLGRQHYHGFLTVSNIAGFYTKDIHVLRMIGTFCIKQQTMDSEGIINNIWFTYCTKQQEIWKDKFNLLKQ